MIDVLTMTVFAVLVGGAIGNGWLLAAAVGDWRAVERSGWNGARQVIARSAVRRKTVRAVMQCGLAILFGVRALTGASAPPLLALLVVLVLVAVLTVDTVGDAYDRRSLHTYFGDRRRTDRKP